MRGHYYRPLDLGDLAARHPLVGWGAEAALDRAAMPLSTALRVYGNSAHLRRGVSELAGDFGKSRVQIGAEWWHGMADRERALAQLTTDYTAFAADVAANARARDAKWVASDALPLVSAWQAFEKSERDSVAILMATDWDTFERWLDKLRAARANARARDFELSSPEPAELPETVWDQAAEGRGGEAVALLGLAKIAIAGGAALVGAVGLVTLVRDIRDRRKVRA